MNPKFIHLLTAKERPKRTSTPKGQAPKLTKFHNLCYVISGKTQVILQNKTYGACVAERDRLKSAGTHKAGEFNITNT
jgi:hypothetical protein